MDRHFHPEGFAPLDAAPVTWVGDQRHSWVSNQVPEPEDEQQVDLVMDGIEGIEMAIENILNSARLGYNIIGSDVAGFSGRHIPPRLYIRWAQFSAFCGLFLNGGHGERALWKRSGEELDIIRKYSWLHTEMIPYMYHYVVEANRGEKPLQRPISGKYQYMFGDFMLVAPIYMDDLKREVRLPAGKWRYLFDDKEVIQGPAKLDNEYPLNEFPVYIREGAVVPLNISRAYTGFGDQQSEGYITWLIYPSGNSEFTYYDPAQKGMTSATLQVDDTPEQITITLEGELPPHILRIHMEKMPEKLMLGDQS